MITINESAKKQLLEIMKSEGKDIESYFLRVGVRGGGCSGLSYEMDFDNEVKSSDEVFEFDGFKVVVDKKFMLYLFGTELQYSSGLNGKGFVWVNPNASRTCGCGESFAV